MKAKIAKKQEIAQDTLLVEFDLQGEQVEFQAGQYFYITLIDAPYSDERGSRRHFSIVNDPQENTKIVMATRKGPSAFKRFLWEAPEGTEVEIGDIMGSFVLPEETDKPLVFIAGGIGITPFMSILRHIAHEGLPHRIKFFYANRSPQSTAFYEELQKLAEENDNLDIVFIMTDDPSWQGEKRLITPEFLKEYLPDYSSYTFYTAGPPVMVEAIEKALHELGVEREYILREDFSGY